MCFDNRTTRSETFPAEDFIKKALFLLFIPIDFDNGPFFALSSPTFYILGIFPSFRDKFQDFCSIKCVYRQIFLLFKQFVA